MEAHLILGLMRMMTTHKQLTFVLDLMRVGGYIESSP